MTVTVERGIVDPVTLAAVDAAYQAAEIGSSRRVIVKGGRLPSSEASGTTHTGDGVVDLRTRILSRLEVERLVLQLRRRNFAAWYRDEAHGGFDPHVHAVRIDCPTLSSSARYQAMSYKAGRDGLTGGGPDYHPRPEQHPYPLEEDEMPTAEQIADAVWSKKTTDPVSGDMVSALTLLKRVRVNAKQAAQTGADPDPEAAATVALIAKELGA